MMKSFLKEVAEYIFKKHQSFDDIVFILPNRRAGIYLKQCIASHLKKPIFSPKIFSIEELIIDISKLQPASHLELLLELYEAFLPHLNKEDQSFESFVLWGTTLLSDFNEIDRNLIDQDSLFDYLHAEQRLKQWGSNPQASPLISSTLKFWGALKKVYQKFQSNLLEKGLAHQGLLYRSAAKKSKTYLADKKGCSFYFLGFNALNKAEETIIQEFLNKGNSNVIWDIDIHLLSDELHEAGLFIRNFLKKWPQTIILDKNSSLLSNDKTISIVGAPKSISQAKLTGNLLNDLFKIHDQQNLALVLSDETLLSPILHSLPANVQKVNITMGIPLISTSLFDFFKSLFELYIKQTKDGWFFKDVYKVVSNPHFIALSNDSDHQHSTSLINYIKTNNILYVTPKFLETEPFSSSIYLKKIFGTFSPSNDDFIRTCLYLINALKESYLNTNAKELYQLYAFFDVFNKLSSILTTKPYLKSINALKFLFNQIVSEEKIDFRGEPLGGLQIMGVLESRNLDFETIVITSVNEGILPAGKNENSFIPYDIKKEFGLPTYKEKDAIYAYHFYRLLQRAKNIHIIYNTEPDVLLGNEKSRFITQLLTDPALSKTVNHQIASPEIKISAIQPKQIKKTPELLRLLNEMATKGFSPSSLSNYIRNPYGYYKKNVLKLSDVNDVEETIAHNTFGTIIHDSLESLYSPFIGQKLKADSLKKAKDKIKPIVYLNFEKFYSSKDLESGQNIITLQVVQKYIATFLDFDIARCNNNAIELLSLEKELKVPVTVPGHSNPIFLRGKLDRLEKVNDTFQILDYKTGNVNSSETELKNIEDSLLDKKYGKGFQLLCYALMEHKAHGIDNLLAGIIPIKKISSGIHLFAQKSTIRGQKNHTINKELLSRFEVLLADLVLQILNANLPFVESESTVL